MAAKREEGGQMDTRAPLPVSLEKGLCCSAGQTARGGCPGTGTPVESSRQEQGSFQVPPGYRDVSPHNQACSKQASVKCLTKMGHFSRCQGKRSQTPNLGNRRATVISHTGQHL